MKKDERRYERARLEKGNAVTETECKTVRRGVEKYFRLR